MRKGTRRAPRTARWQKATALLPLVVLSGALSANAATGERDGLDPTATTQAGTPTVPATAFDQPASVAMPGGAIPGGLNAALAPESDFKFPTGDAPSTTPTSMSSSVNGIPASALKAYQRAAAILNQADPACNIDWPLIAAIGRVESDHGRYGGNALDAQGKAQPGIYGIALDGSNGTALIRDSDGGQFDNDSVYDRAVGPMQFIPGTWSVAGVDADQDGKKDPQDIDDAATASAVYLCAGSDNLATDAGQRAAVYRYNHSNEYVNLVLSIAATYAGGEYTAVPNGTPSSTTLVPQDFQASSSGQPSTAGDRNRPSGGSQGGSTSGGTASSPGTLGGGGGGSSDGGSSGGGSTGGGDGSTGGGDGSTGGGDGSTGGDDGNGGGGGTVPDTPSEPDPVGDAVDGARKTVRDTVGGGGGGGGGGTGGGGTGGGGATEPVEDVLSSSEARALCQQHLPSLLVDTCTGQVVGKTVDEALGIIGGLG
jgi:membrane-bound lytic murein transglycosylase B